jgi:hypothetical protein
MDTSDECNIPGGLTGTRFEYWEEEKNLCHCRESKFYSSGNQNHIVVIVMNEVSELSALMRLTFETSCMPRLNIVNKLSATI